MHDQGKSQNNWNGDSKRSKDEWKDDDKMTGYYVSHELFAIEYSDST